MVPAVVAPAFVVVQPEGVFEFSVVVLDPPVQLPEPDDVADRVSEGRSESQYLTGSGLCSGHWARSQRTGRSSSALFAARRNSMFAGRTWRATNRLVIFPRVPSRQHTSTVASWPAASASSRSDEGSCW